MTSKICRSCNEEKELDKYYRCTIFRKNEKKLDYKTICKICDIEKQRLYKIANKEKYAAL